MQSSQKLKSAHSAYNGANNPFARALAETEKSLSAGNAAASQDQNLSFSQALAQHGDSLQEPSLADALKQQQEAEKLKKKEVLRQRLHDQVNPVDMVNVFNRREKQVKQEIEQIRKELKALVQDIKVLHQEIDIAVMQEVVNPGQDGSYYLNFFQQLRTFIMLLRQRVKSAQTWARQMNAKSAKRKRHGKFSTGVDMSGNSFEQTAAIFDTMHHERSTAYSGA